MSLNNPNSKFKMYILIRESIPLGHALNGAAHASLKCYLHFQNDLNMQIWLKESWKKVTCIASDEEFERAKDFGNHVLLTESALDHAETALAFCPSDNFDPFFKTLRLYK